MRIWSPNNFWTAQQLTTSGIIQYNPAQRGRYLVMVEGMSGATYSVSSLRNGQVNRRNVGTAETIYLPAPNLTDPATNPPCQDEVCASGNPTATTLRNMTTDAVDMLWLTLLFALVLCGLSSVIVRRN